MGQIRHGSATTTHAVRAALQRSQASLATLSKEFGINPKTVAKWRKRQTVEDQKTGPKEPRSTVLSETDEAMIVAFRRHTLLPLDDCLYALQASIPHLTRSALHRCLQRHGISRLPGQFSVKINRPALYPDQDEMLRNSQSGKRLRADHQARSAGQVALQHQRNRAVSCRHSSNENRKNGITERASKPRGFSNRPLDIGIEKSRRDIKCRHHLLPRRIVNAVDRELHRKFDR
jgi:transposase-like protein